MRRLAILGLVLGCAGGTVQGSTRWHGYCCDEATADTRRGCEPITSEGAAACRDAARVPIECRSVAECNGSPERCYCCRPAPGEACTIAVRSERGGPPIEEAPPPEPEPPPSHRPPESTVWSPF